MGVGGIAGGRLGLETPRQSGKYPLYTVKVDGANKQGGFPRPSLVLPWALLLCFLRQNTTKELVLQYSKPNIAY